MGDVGCAPNLEKQSEIGRYRAASGDVGRYRAVSGDFGRRDVSWAGGRLEKSRVNGPQEGPSWGPRETDKEAKRYPQINVYIMEEGTFPGQEGASKKLRVSGSQGEPLGAHKREPRGLRGTFKSMFI